MLRKASVRQMVRMYLSAKEADEFALWAFGTSYGEMSSTGLMREWNRRHGDWVNINSTDLIADSVEDMVKIWELCRS